jgi:alpha-L-rhamnosidase
VLSQLWLYKYYGNKRSLSENWNATKGYMELLTTTPPVYQGLGDWMATEHATPAMTAALFQRESFLAAANISAIIGEPAAEQDRWRSLAAQNLQKFNAQFLNTSSGVYRGPGRTDVTQCGQAAPLFMGAVPASSRALAVERLVESVAAANGLMMTGMFGVKYFLMSLSEAGHTDLAFAAITAEAMPSYGYMLANGSTTTW